MANDILSYTSRDFKSIKEDLIDAIPSLTGTWTSRDDGDPGIVLVKLMSALGDMLSFNSDKQALEYYGATVTQRKNAARLFELVGYHMHWYRAAITDVYLTYRAALPKYVSYYKQIIDLKIQSTPTTSEFQSAKTILTKYLTSYPPYKDDSDPTDVLSMYCPPHDIPLPNGMTGYYKRAATYDDDNLDITDQDVTWFIQAATSTYEYWQNDKDNALGVYRYIEDTHKTLGLYSAQSSNIPYMLIPTDQAPSTNGNRYNPTDLLKPYTPTKFEAIQGYLCTTTFNGNQLKKNRFYVPDSFLDEDHMWLSYSTITDNITQEPPIFIEKTDNLLTLSDFSDGDGESTKIFFQFRVDEFDYPYIELASYWNTVISSPDSVSFKFYYIKTKGKSGNITTNYLTKCDVSADVVVQNLANTDSTVDTHGNVITRSGYNPETAREAYIASQNYIMTYNTLVTIYDFERFLKRQEFVSNGFVCDSQHAYDLNDSTLLKCRSYTKDQLLSILGNNADASMTKRQLEDLLASLQYVKASPSVDASSDDNWGFEHYTINLCPIINDYETVSDDYQVAIYNNKYDDVFYPYKLYRIFMETDPQVTENNYKYAKAISKAMEDTKIVITKPNYNTCRVFEWRCCGTLHLTQVVTDTEAVEIIENVVNALSIRYAPQNVEFGKKITYMDVVDTITQCDDRIRYFDAGIGDKKLIDFAIPDNAPAVHYNVEAYFNPESIMRYVQKYDGELNNEESPYYNYICIDPMYIQSKSMPSRQQS